MAETVLIPEVMEPVATPSVPATPSTPELLKTLPVDTLKAEANQFVAVARTYVVKTAADFDKAAQLFATLKAQIKALETERVRRVKPLNDSVSQTNKDFNGLKDQFQAAVDVLNIPMVAFKKEEERLAKEAEAAAQRERDRLKAIEDEKVRLAEEEAKRLRDEAEAATKAAETTLDPFDAVLLAQDAAAKNLDAAVAAETFKGAVRESAAVVKSAPKASMQRTTAAGVSFRKTWKFRITDAALIPRQYLIPDEQALGLIARNDHDTLQIPGVEFYEDAAMGGR